MRKLLLLPLLLAMTAGADEPQRQPFPDNFTPSPCAPDNACRSFDPSVFASAASRFLGFTIDHDWIKREGPRVTDDLKPMCRKIATCYATPGNFYMFCNDAVMPEMRAVCDKRYTKGTFEHDQCGKYIETFALGVDQQSKATAEAAQKCGWEKTPKLDKPVPPVVWMEPASIPRDYKGYIIFYAYDPDTKVPVPARVEIENQKIYAPSNPAGTPATYFRFKWPIKFNRVTNAQGYRDVEAPMVTVQADGYKVVKFRMPADVPKMTLTMSPAKLKPGKNTVTITATDSETGKPVEARVMYGERVAGETNKPFELEVKKGKRPDLWVTSLFDRYSDVVISPAAN